MNPEESPAPAPHRPVHRGATKAILRALLGACLAFTSCQDPDKPGAGDDAPGAESKKSASANANTAQTPAPKNTSAPKDIGPPDDNTLKALLAEAASIDEDVWGQVLSNPAFDEDALRAANGETVTVHVLMLTSTPRAATPSFTFAPQVDPAKFAAAIDPSSPRRDHVSVIQPRYITNLDARLADGTLKGSVSFEATNKTYRGTLGFEGVPDPASDAGWRITTFLFLPEKFRIVRGEDGKWSRLEL